MILAGTGHRPEHLGGYAPNNLAARIYAATLGHLKTLKPDKVISGMALGFDMMLAEACIELGIPFIAAIPCATQAGIWPAQAQERWRTLRDRAERVEVLAELYTPSVMHARNRWMVDNSDGLIACWNGFYRGGTYHCVKYAKRQAKPILARINPRTILEEP